MASAQNFISFERHIRQCMANTSYLVNHLIEIEDFAHLLKTQIFFALTYMSHKCQNILHVHARRHSKKRLYVKNEDNPHSFLNEKNNSFKKFLELSRYNIGVLVSGQGKFKEYNDLKNILEKK